MHLARAALRASARSLENQRQVPRLLVPLVQKHDFSVLATVEWDPDRSQYTSRNPSPGIHWRQRNPLRHEQPQHLQVRFRRHDRSSAFSKPRPQTKKQRQKYNRTMKKLADEKDAQSPPGSKAGPRRQWKKERIQQLLDYGTDNEVLDPNAEEEYGFEDALFEDIMGNTAELTSQPTPEPMYLGNKHKQFYNKVANQMDRYRDSIDARSQKDNELLDVASEEGLPSDKSISNVLRAYRDRHGTRNKPIGIVKALQHLLKDIGVPTVGFGEYTYTALLTCCRTPKEARRIFKLITDHQHPISAYSWSILVDIHAKLGDFEGCGEVMKEMASEGVPPTQAAYTSLLAACYKVCNDGRIPHPIRAKAGKFGWQQWQEMRIVGIEPDVMAYGAIIRLCASRGQPERAINLLEDMLRFDVKPTTLCFSSALRSVAKSHEIAIRFERGWSRKQLRRESFAAHHGKMARLIVIMAENAEVQLDDGFVSALMLCSAAAGDSATAKAIYLAAEVRKMDHLRTIGPDSSLKQLRGETSPDISSLLALGDSKDTELHQLVEESSALVTNPGQSATLESKRGSRGGLTQDLTSFGEREYGKDSRSLSALLRSCAQAMNSNGIGTMWAGKQNLGYLCENSQRLITTRWEPSYTDTSIPGVDSTKVGINALRRYDEDARDDERKKGVRKKFRGLYVDDDAALTVDELDDSFQTDFDDDTEEAYSEDEDPYDEGFLSENAATKAQVGLVSSVKDNIEYARLHLDDLDEGARTEQGMDTQEEAEGLLFQEGIDEISLDESELFNIFFSELKEEALRNGEDVDLKEEDVRGLFKMMQEEFADALGDDGIDDLFDDSTGTRETSVPTIESIESFDSIDPVSLFGESGSDSNLQSRVPFHDDETRDIEGIIEQIKNDMNVNDFALDGDEYEGEMVPRDNDRLSSSEDVNILSNSGPEIQLLDDISTASSMNQPTAQQSLGHSDETVLSEFDSDELEKIKDLQTALPGMPLSRIKKILKAFNSTLGYPSLISLVPILRETMPDYITSGWLKRINTQNADFVLQKASEEALIDTPLLNTMLQVKTSGASLDEALTFYDEEYRKHKKKPTGYSDRLIVQMLVTNKRLPRALAFKQKIEMEGRSLDLPSYGSLVEYYARHDQLGSALMLLKECVTLHGAPPSEKYLVNLRLVCRQKNLENEIRLTDLIGEDPIEWLRYGEKYLKREMSKKGRRGVQLARNRIIQA